MIIAALLLVLASAPAGAGTIASPPSSAPWLPGAGRAVLSEARVAPPRDRRPNIVLVMADDMGFTDIGCYGGEIQTPALDRLAAGGVRMTQFYNTSRCCPTRASLLTGLYSHQAGIGLMTSDRGTDAYRGDLNRRCVTLAEALGRGGYRAYLSGKWHVTKHVRADGLKHNWPLQRGFDRFYGTITGAGSFYDPTTLCRGNTFITPENDPLYQPERFYYSDAISENAQRFIEDHFDGEHAEAPLFLYVSYTSAHWPMHAPEEEIDAYDGLYDRGFAPVAAARRARAVELGLLDERWQQAPLAREWQSMKHLEWEARNMECYAAMVTRMDRGIAGIVESLEGRGELDNTLFVYLQDNGGCAENMGFRSNAKDLDGVKYEPLGPDGLQMKIWPPMQTRDGRAVRTGPAVMAGPEDSYVSYGPGWASVSNAPFRGFKHDGLEGGISTPFIVHWPAGLGPERAGKIVHAPGHLIDVMPTFLRAGGGAYPAAFSGSEVQPMEGVDLMPHLRGGELERERPLFFEHHGNLAMRDGRFKIVSTYRKAQPVRWALYDMWSDRTELHDLSAEQPGRVAQMASEWQAWAARVGVRRWPY